MQEPARDQTIVMDPVGDLILRVGSNSNFSIKNFKVCSSSLRRASPVQKKMLFGPGRESQRDPSGWLVELPDDDPAAMHVLLDIIHG